MESDFHRWLNALERGPRAELPLNDDAQLLRLDGTKCVTAADLICEGVHFTAETSDAAIGYKALAVNLSDLAAMAAIPRGAVVSLLLPRRAAAQRGRAILAGMLELSRRFDCPLVGGDTNVWSGPLAVAVTVLGEPSSRGPLSRSTAQVGDTLVVTGPLGGSLRGRHLSFPPRVREALQLHRDFRLHAGIDLSDGLLLDGARLGEASGIGVEIDLTAVPISDDARALADEALRENQPGADPLERALSDGEDFELLLAAAPEEVTRMQAHAGGIELFAVGRCVPEPGLWTVDEAGRRSRCQPRGYEHRGDEADAS